MMLYAQDLGRYADSFAKAGFTGLDLELAIKEHYYEVLDVFSDLFIGIFDVLIIHTHIHVAGNIHIAGTSIK